MSVEKLEELERYWSCSGSWGRGGAVEERQTKRWRCCSGW